MEFLLKTNIISYSDMLNGGIPINISLDLEEYTFLGIYWIHPIYDSIFIIEPNFLKLFGVSETTELPFIDILKKI